MTTVGIAYALGAIVGSLSTGLTMWWLLRLPYRTEQCATKETP